MDNRRVAKVYRDKSQRVKVLPFAPPSGLFSKVKRYFSTSGLPSRIASFTGSSEPAKNTQNPPNTERNASTPNPGFVLPEPFVSADISTLSQGPDDSNRILSSFFQEKGNAPLSQVEYEGVMSLLERSKASVTLPLPDHTPEKPAAKNHADTVANRGPQNPNHTFSQYSQKVLRNTSAYDPSFASNTSVVTADYKPVYHTFHDGSRANVSMKRVYPFSGVPSPYATRIQAPNLAARKARRIASAAPSVSSMDHVADVSTETTSFKPRSKAANSLLSILDANTSTQENATNTSTVASKPLHNPYARPKRFTPLHKEDILETASPSKAEEISKTVSYNKAEELPTNGDSNNEKTSLFGSATNPTSGTASDSVVSGVNSEKPLLGSQKTSVDGETTSASAATEAPKPLFSFGASKPNNNLFGASESSSAGSSGLFGSKPNGLVGESAKSSTSELPTGTNGNGNGTEANDKPAPFSFGAKPSVPSFGQEEKKSSNSAEEQNAPVFNFGAKTNDAKPAFNFGSKPDPKTATLPKKTEIETIDVESEDEDQTESKPALFNFGAKPAFNFGAKPKDDNSSFASKPSEDTPKPAFNFGAKSVDEKDAAPKPAFSFGAKPVEDKPAEDKPTSAKPAFNFGAKPAADKPTFNFGAKPVEEKPTPKPAFGFGAKATEDKPAFSFGAKPTADKDAAAKPAFSFGAKSSEDKPVTPKPALNFGAKPAEEKSTEDKPTQEKSAAPKPAFSFGKPADESVAAKPVFNFGAKPAENKSVSEKPAFSFGAKPTEDKPAFAFGAKPAAEKPAEPTGAETPVAKPAFGFGSKPAEENSGAEKPAFGFGAKPADSKPAFNFGAKSAEDKSVSETPAFGFGSKPADAKTDTSKPAFGFGSKATDEQSTPKPAFSFGAPSAEAKPAFNFGAKPVEQKPAQDKPAFSFGATPADTKPAFSFGAKPAGEKPAFSFGAKPSQDKPVDDKSDGSKPFSFGASSTNESTDNKPAFSFGSKSNGPAGIFAPKENNEQANESQTQKPAFSFGAKPTEGSSPFNFGAQKDNGKPGFSFGANPSEAKPAFNFGASNTQAQVGLSGRDSGSGQPSSVLENDFEFPEIPVKQASLRQEKVKEYEELFEF